MESLEESPAPEEMEPRDGVLAIVEGKEEKILTRDEAIRFHMEALEELAEPHFRSDGWTPFARKLFLQVLAETGRVNRACETCFLSKQSAYCLRNRDPVFAAGWDAAAALARMTLADELMERAMSGVTETVLRDGKAVGERHRHDNRLSIAVLNRLDKRCDRAEAAGAPHLGAMANWNEFIRAVGADDPEYARTLLERGCSRNASAGQASQEIADEEENEPDNPRVWWDEDREAWRTDFPPPRDFDGDERNEYGAWGYSRSLTEAEQGIVEGREAMEWAEQRDGDEQLRDKWFSLNDVKPDCAADLPEALTDSPSALQETEGRDDECPFLDVTGC